MPIAPHFLVLIPGFGGSLLRVRDNTKRIVWIDLASIPLITLTPLKIDPLKTLQWLNTLFKEMAFPSDTLEPGGILNDNPLFVLPLLKKGEYGRLLDEFAKMGYRVDPRLDEKERNVYTFDYDWRKDIRQAARELAVKIEHWRSLHDGAQAWIVGHSGGGIVARWYIEREGGKDHVGRLFLFASPWDGAVEMFKMLQNGFESFGPLKLSGAWFEGVKLIDPDLDIPRRTRDAMRSFPASYQIIPHQDPFLRDEVSSNVVDPFASDAWLETAEQKRLLADGKKFNQELGTKLSVETFCFYGNQALTLTEAVIRFEPGQHWGDIDWRAQDIWKYTEPGDGTLTTHTSKHVNANQVKSVNATHRDIYVSEVALDSLRVELTEDPNNPDRAVAKTEKLLIQFEPDKNYYAPGETIQLWTTVADIENEAPVSDAIISVQMLWQDSLLGNGAPAPEQNLATKPLWETETTRGRYEGSMTAPNIEGYYRLHATVRAQGNVPVTLDELIAVAGEPTA